MERGLPRWTPGRFDQFVPYRVRGVASQTQTSTPRPRGKRAPAKRRWPSGLKASLWTVALHPFSSSSSLPVAASHSLTSPPCPSPESRPPPEARRRPSGLKVRHQTCSCPFRVYRSFPVAVSHTAHLAGLSDSADGSGDERAVRVEGQTPDAAGFVPFPGHDFLAGGDVPDLEFAACFESPLDPAAVIRRPSRLNTTLESVPGGRWKVLRSLPVAASHTFSTIENPFRKLNATTPLASGLKATSPRPTPRSSFRRVTSSFRRAPAPASSAGSGRGRRWWTSPTWITRRMRTC